MEYAAFFRKAACVDPYPYQTGLSSGPWPDLLEIPTGLGKTAAVIIAWLHRRLQGDDKTHRRLVYCLPMRVLVEQTRDCVNRWVDAVSGEFVIKGMKIPAVHVLMGGEDAGDFDLFPEGPAILIGTQDMLLSRALNRGYGMSRYRWPSHFGLLNNDCLWVVDEVQLMGSGLSTTVQLQAFRERFGVLKETHTLWMSATTDPDWFRTVDFDPSAGLSRSVGLSTSDIASESVVRRFGAKKPIARTSSTMDDTVGLTNEILSSHMPRSRTLVVVNTVARAMGLHSTLKKAVKKSKTGVKLVLVHSRFRPGDRKTVVEEMLQAPPDEGTIVVSTQVVEAGVDVSAKTLFTELCPWPSMVQRFGRCNRSGEFDDSRVFWIDLPPKGDKFAAPYKEKDLHSAREIMGALSDVGIRSLPKVPLPFSEGCVLRQKDLVDLFDTTSGISGLDIDVSRFIRETSDHDVQVFWREFDTTGPDATEPPPLRNELCAVPVRDVRELVKNKRYPWRRNALSGEWERCIFPETVLPGGTFLLSTEAGCYTLEAGWSPESKSRVAAIPPVTSMENDYNDADALANGKWKDVATHTEEVVSVLAALCDAVDVPQAFRAGLISAGRWHDAGKAHPAFQAKIAPSALATAPVRPVAKAPKEAWILGRVPNSPEDGRRRHFRHELASALLALAQGQSDLAAYLAAAHHGKVRFSIRSLPNESVPDNDVRFARGVWEGDIVPEVDLAGGVTSPEAVLDLGLMEMGRFRPDTPSWGERMAGLRDSVSVGPFRLALLEALIKAADERASRGGR